MVGQKGNAQPLLASLDSKQNENDESLGTSSLKENELAFHSLRAKQKLQKNLASSNHSQSKSLRDPLTHHQNLLNLVTEIDHQMKAMEQRLTDKIDDRDTIFERIENQIDKLQ